MEECRRGKGRRQIATKTNSVFSADTLRNMGVGGVWVSGLGWCVGWVKFQVYGLGRIEFQVYGFGLVWVGVWDRCELGCKIIGVWIMVVG